MKKCRFIIPYFGSLPNGFAAFLKSCEYNPEYNWIVFTDDKSKYNYPSNVEVVYMSFEELKEIIQSKFDFTISLNAPYKLCDFKPAYGYIFEEYLDEYEFWGHCDIDVVLGDLNKFITQNILSTYDKIFCLGHMILYKNNHENNRVFMSSLNGIELYKKAFSTEQITTFDETYGGYNNVNTIFLDQQKKVLMEDWSANFCVLPTKFIKTTFNPSTYSFDNEDNINALYIWNKGKIQRVYKRDGKLVWEEFLYIHLQGRKIKMDESILDKELFKIVPNCLAPLEVNEITIDNFEKIKKSYVNIHFFRVHYKRKKKTIKKMLKHVK